MMRLAIREHARRRERVFAEATQLLARGNAGEPDSPHWADTVADWRDGRYRPMHFRRADVEADLEERLTLTP